MLKFIDISISKLRALNGPKGLHVPNRQNPMNFSKRAFQLNHLDKLCCSIKLFEVKAPPNLLLASFLAQKRRERKKIKSRENFCTRSHRRKLVVMLVDYFCYCPLGDVISKHIFNGLKLFNSIKAHVVIKRKLAVIIISFFLYR